MHTSELNYVFISGGFRITPDFLPGNGDTETKGRTKEFSLGMDLFFRYFSNHTILKCT
jgi:hypothetical protein